MTAQPSRLRLLAVIEAHTITGPAKNLLDFVRLSREEIETTLVTFTRGAPSNVFVATVRRHGIPVEIIEERGVFDHKVLGALGEIVTRVRPDILQTHAVKSHFLTRWAGLHHTTPWIAFHHGYTWPSLRVRLYNRLDHWSLRAARQVLTVSGSFREELVARGVRRDRIQVIHNASSLDWGLQGRDSKKAELLRSTLGIAPDRNVVLSVGRLSREKNHLALLRAFRDLPAEAHAHLVIVGDGPERSRIDREVRVLGIGGQVTLVGQQDSTEAYYGIAQVAVLASLSEGSPNALLEAMASGVPVVATRVGGIPEIVTDAESAYLVPPGNNQALRDALAALLQPGSDLPERLALEAKRLLQARYAPMARVRTLLDIYRSLVPEPAPRVPHG